MKEHCNTLDIYKMWENPSNEYRPVQIIHQHTPHSRDGMEEFLHRASDMGLGGFVVNVDVGPKDPEQFSKYLVDENEWARLKLFISLALEKGFKIWLYDERGYPSGAAGKWVIEGNPEYQVKGIICQSEEVHSQGHGKIVLEEGRVLSAAAYKREGQNLIVTGKISLTEYIEGGCLRWQLPEGEWFIAVFILRNLSWIAKAGTPYVDILDPAAVRKFINVTHEKYYNELGPSVFENIEAIFTDEPSLPVHGCGSKFYEKHPVIPWTLGLEEKFRNWFGYSLLDNVEKLFFQTTEPFKKVRRDYWKIVSRTLEDSYFRQIGEWCKERNTCFTGHLYGEETLSMQVGLEGELFGMLRYMQIPGIDRLYCTNPRDIIPEKTASSVAHLLGRKRVMSESSSHFELNRWALPVDITDIINAGTYQFALGINTIASYFKFAQVSDEERALYQTYMGRLSSMLSIGTHIAPVLIHVPMVGIWERFEAPAQKYWEVGPGHVAFGQTEAVRRLEKKFGDLLSTLMDNQWDFDLIDDRGLCDCRCSENAKIVTAFESFKVLIVFDTGYTESDTVAALNRFLEQGAFIIVVREDGNNLSEWSSEHESKLNIVKDIDDVVRILERNIEKDFRLKQNDPHIWYLHRQCKDMDVYLVYNRSDKEKHVEVDLEAEGTVEVLYPLTGVRQILGSSRVFGVPAKSGVLLVVHSY